MRRITILSVVVLLLFANLFAGTKPLTREVIEQNYIMGVNSDNEGLIVSAAYFLGEMKSTAAIIPLMKILRESDFESARLMAALSLIKIGNPQGVYMVKRTALFNNVERVRKMAEKLYAAHLALRSANADKEVKNAVKTLAWY